MRKTYKHISGMIARRANDNVYTFLSLDEKKSYMVPKEVIEGSNDREEVVEIDWIDDAREEYLVLQERATSMKEDFREAITLHSPFGLTKSLGEQRKTEAIAFLTANDMDTPNNRALINAVKFTPDAIEIGGVRWSYNNLQASDIGMNYSTDTKAQPKNYKEAHVFKGEGKFAQEDYFTRKAIDTLPAIKKAKIPTDIDMENTLKALPLWTQRGSWGKGSAKILSILLGTQMSGYRRAGERFNAVAGGCLRSASPHVSGTSSAWAFERDSSKGSLDDYHKGNAFPCRPLA